MRPGDGDPGPGGYLETCQTRNLSSGGVLFATHEVIHVGDAIEYEIALPGKKAGNNPVRLHCKGKVLRSLPGPESKSTVIAATLERYEFLRHK